MSVSQKDMVLDHLQRGRTITPLEALNLYGSMRLSAIIKNLRDENHNIVTDYPETGKRYAIYRLVKPGELA